MTAYIVRRVLQMPIVILMVWFALFVALHLPPGDPIYAMIGVAGRVSPDPHRRISGHHP